MRFLISQRCEKRRSGEMQDALETSYTRFFDGLGAKLVPVPNSVGDLRSYLSGLEVDGVILSGGNDINPKLYGGPASDNENICDERDHTERQLIDLAVEKKWPVLGICRGAEFINIFFKGGLLNDINKKANESGISHLRPHDVKIVNGIALKYFGYGVLIVNSYHNQGINKRLLSPELEPFALSENDGLVEGFYHRTKPIAGVQWHPDRPNSDLQTDKKIAKAFIKRELFWKI